MDSSEGKRLLSELRTEQLLVFFSPCNLKIKWQCNGLAIYYTHGDVSLSPALECIYADPNVSDEHAFELSNTYYHSNYLEHLIHLIFNLSQGCKLTTCPKN